MPKSASDYTILQPLEICQQPSREKTLALHSITRLPTYPTYPRVGRNGFSPKKTSMIFTPKKIDTQPTLRIPEWDAMALEVSRIAQMGAMRATHGLLLGLGMQNHRRCTSRETIETRPQSLRKPFRDFRLDTHVSGTPKQNGGKWFLPGGGDNFGGYLLKIPWLENCGNSCKKLVY